MNTNVIRLLLATFALSALAPLAEARTWWNEAWNSRVKFTLDTSDNGVPVPDAPGTSTVLFRLHDGVLDFTQCKEDGTDLRFVDADDKTMLASQIEKFDPVMNEGFVWVKVPEIKSGQTRDIYLYYGRNEKKKPAKGEKTDLPKTAYDGDTVSVYHFNEHGTPPGDSSGNGVRAETPGIPVDGSMIGGGIKLDAKKPISVPANPNSAILESAPFTWMCFVKPTSLDPDSIIYSRKDGGNGIKIGLDSGAPFFEVTSAAGTQRSAPAAPLAAGAWKHLALVSDGTRTTLYAEGNAVANLPVGIPALNSPAFIGGEEGKASFKGEIDEMEISKSARSPGFIKLSALGQGQQNGKLLVVGKPEAAKVSFLDSLGLFGYLIKSVTFDAWVVIGILGIMSAISWIVMVVKNKYISSLSKGSKEFMNQWHHLSGELTSLDTSDDEKVSTLGGKATDAHIKFIHSTPIYRVYHLGCQEIRNRIEAGNRGLSHRSIEAIEASMGAQITRENAKLQSMMVLLTICIAGGPYVGLLGTIIGVMITFGEIAMLGEVDINAIAPGIAAALLATVCGLVVAIPALFGYNYLSVQVKDITTDLHLFLEEFITKMAECYPEDSEARH
jgi:biopolymer transport protein ExbB